MPNPNRAFLLGPLLKGVSRSFYLTLRILPGGMRDPVGLAYLLARAADTIADTALIPPDRRLALLLSLRARVNGAPDDGTLAAIASEVGRAQTVSDEQVLLESLAPAVALLDGLDATDRAAVRGIVTTLTRGMEFDLSHFPDERAGQIRALARMADLDEYTYLVAGCVGEFWTRMTYAHRPGRLGADADLMTRRGIRFGKALQMVNVLRDCGKDLRIGRCYLPTELLAPAGLTPEALLLDGASLRARPIMHDLVGQALAHFKEALAYTLALPPTAIRLRLACLWPLLIGLETLVLLVRNDAWLAPEHASKVSRTQIYRMMAKSLLRVGADRALRRWAEGLMDEVERAVDPTRQGETERNRRQLSSSSRHKQQ